jgi:hypothetical protein
VSLRHESGQMRRGCEREKWRVGISRKFIAVSVAALLCGTAAVGQESFDPSNYTGMAGALVRGAVLSVGFHPFAGHVPVILNEPFSAEQQAERHQTLADGTHIDQDARPTKIWRDSSGRTRVERAAFRYETPMTRGFPAVVVISDPVAGYQYVLDPQEHVAHRYAAQFTVIPPPAATKDDQPPVTDARLDAAHETIRTESLGTQVIEGLQADGKRMTILRDASRGDTEGSGEMVVETWTSSDLRVELLYKCDDRSSADNVRGLHEVSRSEPSAALFEVPAGYTIVDETGEFRVNLQRQ